MAYDPKSSAHDPALRPPTRERHVVVPKIFNGGGLVRPDTPEEVLEGSRPGTPAGTPVIHSVGAHCGYCGEDHGTIASAIRAASQGDMIMIHPGRYAERIPLPFPMQLVARKRGTSISSRR